MVITLSRPNDFKNSFTIAKRSNCKHNPCNTSYHIQSMLLHYLWKIKFQICDKLRITSTFSRSVIASLIFQSLASRTSCLSIRGWRSTATITTTCSCRSSCCPWRATCQAISSSFNKTANLQPEREAPCNFLSSQHPLSFLQICSRGTVPTLIRSITTYGVTSSSECIGRCQLHCSVDELKIPLLDVWHGVDQSATDVAIGEWRKHLRVCVPAKVGHFEQLL